MPGQTGRLSHRPRKAARLNGLSCVPCAVVLIAASGARAEPCALPGPFETVAVERALDGDTVALDDGRVVRLPGVVAPKAPLGVAAGVWPLDAMARAALSQATAGKVLELRLVGAGSDRHGRLRGHLAAIGAADHAEIAAKLLGEGALLRSGEDAGRGCGATLAAVEDRAVRARLGLWSEPYYEVQDASDGARLMALAGRFVVAEGRVASVRTSAGRAYVNFGSRWRAALSLALSEAALRKLGGFAGLGLEAGARIRARGVVEARRGPVIRLSEAGQVERLDGPR